MSTPDHISPFIAWMARLGLGARAFVYLAVAVLLFLATFGPAPANGVSPSEAFKVLEEQTGGRMLLILIGIGLFLYALWRFEQATFDPEKHGTDAKGIVARGGMIASGISYLLVGIAAFTITMGSNQDGGSNTTKQVVQWLIDKPFGRWLVGLVGLAIIGVGCAQIWRAWEGQWKKHLDLHGWPQRFTGLVSFGIAARGVLFLIIGGFVIYAGIAAQTDQVKGLAGTMGWLREQPFGFWLFLAAALAILAYGIYSTIQSLRYRFPEEES